MKCNHHDCVYDANHKPLADAVRPEATMRIDGTHTGEPFYRCTKHFTAYDFLHRAVLAFEPQCTDKTTWKPNMVRYTRTIYGELT